MERRDTLELLAAHPLPVKIARRWCPSGVSGHVLLEPVGTDPLGCSDPPCEVKLLGVREHAECRQGNVLPAEGCLTLQSEGQLHCTLAASRSGESKVVFVEILLLPDPSSGPCS